ncbi:hypothetical protein [Sediminibacterium soli]|uniref:hypothetical protein n=1 Tax=Sediminibacterium soli TaxID=2698829 RepID=UPI00137A8791|nr:hypothetical protein [Sediminibacterium soli]NCI47295.1 hypothetical protein [Sediminibacterium soli]
MKKPIPVLFSLFLLFGLQGRAQQITYSEPDRDDARSINFEILGKISGNVLVYKNYRDQHFIAIYDNDMKLTDRVKMDYLSGRISNTEFIQYPEFIYMLYEYQRRNTVYSMAVKIGADGKKIGEPVQLDTTELSFGNNRIYSIVNSDDRQKIMVFKINTRNDKAHILTTSLFDRNLTLLRKSRLSIPMPQRNDFLTEFTLDNDGDLGCIRASGTASNDNINKVSLIVKPALSDNIVVSDLKFANIYLDDIRIKPDNIHKHFVVTSFYSKQRRGNIEGLYYSLWDKTANREIMNATSVFSDEFREDAKPTGNSKTAFNDYFLKNIILRKDGGFLVMAESVYTTSRGNTLNRWDYLYGSPYWTPLDYYYWNSPAGYYPWWRSNIYNNLNTMTRYYADNVAVISFEPGGKLEWSNVIRKSQYDDNTDNFIGYGLLNMGSQLHFLFNVQEKRALMLSDQSIAPSGQIDRTPTFKNMDKGYEFMPRHAKQVGSRVAVIPCQFRGFICFAKIEF